MSVIVNNDDKVVIIKYFRIENKDFKTPIRVDMQSVKDKYWHSAIAIVDDAIEKAMANS